ncbi:MAG: AhpC/TSA family protein [Anaerolineales bacterium]|nr:MAG: AhpC/TSA family protein [Anaerolineales bacterium]
MPDSIDAQFEAAEKEWIEGWKRGPRRLRWDRVPLQVGDQAPDHTLLDTQSNRIPLKSLWKEKPALIIFWRHYGCSCGVDRANRLISEYDAYREAGANIVIIGQGEPERTAAYAKKYHLPAIPILCDPEYQVYESFGLVDGKPSQILFDAPEEYLDLQLEAGLSLAKSRREEGRPLVDNSWLLPGEFVVDAKGEVRLAYRYNYCEDFPDHRVLVAAIREARLASAR